MFVSRQYQIVMSFIICYEDIVINANAGKTSEFLLGPHPSDGIVRITNEDHCSLFILCLLLYVLKVHQILSILKHKGAGHYVSAIIV